MKKGFTLVELSIVLVVIGLLVGGILAAQSMIESSRLNAQVKQFQQFDIVINNFKENYKYLPGDLPNATDYFGTVVGNCNNVPGTGTQTCNGDGDGHIDYVWAGYDDDNLHESFRAWEHLSFFKMLDIVYSGAGSTDCVLADRCIVPGINIPKAAIDNKLGIVVFHTNSNTVFAANGGKHVYGIGSPTNTVNPLHEGNWTGRGLTPAQAMALDSKMDDGKPLAGNIGMLNGAMYGPTCTGGNYSASAKYDLSYTGKACTLLIEANFGE